MPTISVIYPRREGATFDFDYYEKTHLPLVAEKWGGAGLESATALRGTAGADGKEAPYIAIALIRFGSLEQFQAAATSDAGRAVIGDVPNFTNVAPVIQINERVG